MRNKCLEAEHVSLLELLTYANLPGAAVSGICGQGGYGEFSLECNNLGMQGFDLARCFFLRIAAISRGTGIR